MRASHSVLLFSAVCLQFGLTGGAFAEPSGDCAEPARCADAAPLPGGQVAIIDPETGELIQDADPERMSEETRDNVAEFNEQLQQQLSGQFSVEGLEERRLDSGTVAVDLGDRFKVPYVVHIGEDGTQHFTHGQIILD